MQKLETKIINYNKKYHKQVIKLFADFQDYLIQLDPLKRLRRMPGYEENVLKETLNEVQEKDGIFYLAIQNEKIIGLAVGIIIKQTSEDLLNSCPVIMGRITELYVDSSYRGMGIGTVLMKKLENYFKQKNCQYVWVEVFTPNINAHNLYTKLKYKDRDVEMIKILT